MSGIFENARQILQNLHILRQRGYEQINMVRPLLNMVARARGYNFEPGTQFAIDLTKEPPTAYFDMNFYVKEQGYTPEQSEFALLHEIRCHLVEKDKLQESDEGKAAYEERRVREEQVDWLHIWENCRTDAAGNWSILLEISPALQEAAESLYKDKLFASRDFRKMPRHLQFCYAVLVEKMLPSATDVQVVPEVREAIDRLKNTSFVAPDGQVYQDALEYVTRPDRLWDSGDLALWRYQMSKEYVEPEIEKLYEEDLKNPDPDWQKQKGKGKGRRKGSAGKSPFAGEYQDYNSRIHPQTWSEDDEQKLPESTRPQNEEGAEEQDNTDEDDSENDASSSPQPPKMDQSQREQFKSKHGLTEGEMQVMESYDQVYREVSPYIESLRQVFLMVLDRRKWFTPGVAHNQEHGRNTGRSLRNQYIGSSGGNGDKHAPRPAKANMSGEIAHEEILPIASTWHLVLDQSGSMAGYPSQMQLRAAVLFMEVLSKFEEEAEKLGAPLDIQSELRAFGTPRTPTTLYKKIDDKLTMRKRVAIFQGASGAYGGTNDYDSLAEIVAQINQRMAKDAKYRDELANGARREFVVVLTDGGSGDPVAVNMQLQTLIDMGVKIVGVGMGASGKPVLTTYNVGKIAGKKGSSEAQVCYNIGSLPNIIAQMLEADIRSLDTL